MVYGRLNLALALKPEPEVRGRGMGSTKGQSFAGVADAQVFSQLDHLVQGRSQIVRL